MNLGNTFSRQFKILLLKLKLNNPFHVQTFQGEFEHNIADIHHLDRVTLHGIRHYNTPIGPLPSVTTVLSSVIKDGLLAWEDRIGFAAAERVRTQASGRGTRVHDICERYVGNEVINPRSIQPANYLLFKSLRPLLDKNITNVRGIEATLWSKYLKVAGTVDLVANWDGVLSIIDYKTSKREKKEEWVDGYFMQEAAYAVAWEELTGEPIQQLVTVVANESAPPQIFVDKRDNWIYGFINIRKEFQIDDSSESELMEAYNG